MAGETRNAKLILGVETTGTRKAQQEVTGLGKSVNTLDNEIANMGKDMRATFDQAINSVEALEDEIRKDLVNAIKEAGNAADNLEINPKVNTGGGGTPAAAKFRGAASLIGGGEIVGLIDDLQDLGEGFSQLATQGGKLGGALVNTLTPAIGSTAAGVAVAGAAFAAAGIALAALGAAIAAFTAEQEKNQKTIEGIVQAQRSVDEKINAGATTKELNDERATLIKNLEDERQRVEKLRALYQENIDDNPGGGLARLVSGAEEGLANSINETDENIRNLEAQVNALTGGIESGETAAADMKAAEEELAEQRDKEAGEILKRAARAASEVNARNRALDATEEQNLERLDSIEQEKEAIQAQIAVLQASGSTAEAVTGQIAELNAQLGSLGQESQFIEGTALAVSRAADAQKKALKDAEDAAKEAEREQKQNIERAAAAQDKYNDALQQAGIALKQAQEDINTKLSQSLADNLTGLFRDVDDIAQKFRRDTFDADLKANQAERDALIEHQRDIEDIIADGKKSELEAIRDGDFKALYLARQQTEDELRQEQRDTRREREDRQRANEDERADLLRNAQRERADRLVNFDRQNVDSRLNAQRELQQAQVNRGRQLEAAANAYRAELAQLGQYLQARNQMQAQANQAALQNMSGMTNPKPGNGMIGNQAGIPASMINQTFLQVTKK